MMFREDLMSTEDTTNQTAASSAVKRVKLTRTLPTDRITFYKQSEILRAFAAAYEKANAPVSNDDVGRLVGMAGSTVSQINAFFVDVGLLARADTGKFTPTTPAIEYLKLHQFSADRAWSKLAPVFEKSWFGQELVAKLKFRSVDESEAITDLALASNAEKGYEPQLKIAIDWLVLVGVAVREGTQIKLAHTSTPSQRDVPSAPNNNQPPTTAPDTVEEGLHRSVLPLDASSKRRLVVWAPPTITAKELERIKSWLAVQIIVSDDSTG